MRLWSLWAISRWEVATTANYNNQQTTNMNVHELLDILIVATGTLAVLLTAAILELIRYRKEAKKVKSMHREAVAKFEARVGKLHEDWMKQRNDYVRLRRQLHELRMKNLHK